MSEFYTKEKNNNILDFISKNTKINIAWEMVKNGANVNEVFSNMNFEIDDYLGNNQLKSANDTIMRKNTKEVKPIEKYLIG